MAKKTTTESPVAFRIGLEEFAGSIPVGEIESRKAFVALMKSTGQAGTRQTKKEWSALYQKFKTQPVGVPWSVWAFTQGGK